MNAKLVFLATFLLVSGSVLADAIHNVTRNVPQPMSPPTLKSLPAGALGEEAARANPLMEENVRLKNLINLQNQKIQLLETRLKELEQKK